MEVEKSLHEAAILGDVHLLELVLQRDPLILDRISVGSLVHTPLHVAAFRGHLEFVRTLLSKNPDLAGVLDLRRWSALHLAAAKGHRSVVKELVQANPDMCTALDADGRNPLHLATIKGDIDVLIEFFEAQPHRIPELLSTRDVNDDTVLHLAVKNLQFETLKRFLNRKKAKEAKPTNNEWGLNTINKCGFTPLDILEQTDGNERALNTINKCGFTPLDILEQTDGNEREIYTLRAAGCLKAKEINQAEWLSKQRKSLMVVASVIATMTFQAALTPPSGDNKIASNWPIFDSGFLCVNSFGFFGSIMTIFFLVTGEQYLKAILHTWILVLAMFETVVCTVVAYTLLILTATSAKDRHPLTYVVVIVGWMFCVIMLVLLLGRHFCLEYVSGPSEIKIRRARKEAEDEVKKIQEEERVKKIQEQRGTELLVQPVIFTGIDVASRPS
ncbi:ankyrin repeat-containing protein BDA1-like [Diospyros lotus]|uniref:ankyrin repeat-containing protein BDA1-like n=1 Tax=Diospyros lotus TaxID=55363 RepID=UPI00225B2CA1|nr:ankyrin repeat-containing protein BDA1-like [Diospyros lotus]